MRLLWLAAFYLFFSTSLGAVVNVTIDDTFEHIAYIPVEAWKSGRTPETNLVHDGTWHSSISPSQNITTPSLAVVPFSGSAIYIYCILPTSKTFPNGTNMIFLIDGQPAGTFNLSPWGEELVYDFLVYANRSLPQGNHTLTIQNGLFGGSPSLIILDYIIYTNDTESDTPGLQPVSGSVSGSSPSPPPSPSVNSSGKIVGAVFGSVGIILLFLVVYLWHRQRKATDNLVLSTPRSNSPGFSAFIWIRSRSGHPPKPPPKPPKILPLRPNRVMSRMHRWWHSSTNVTSRLSFDPSLLAEPAWMALQDNRPISRHPLPPPVTTVLPIHKPTRPDSTRPLAPNREATPSPSLDPRNEPSQPLSITEWRRRTQREADATPPRLDVTDEEMSSYYDFSSDTPEQPPQGQQRPKPTPRRFTVMNT